MPLLPAEIAALKTAFGEVLRIDLQGRTLMRIASAPLPRGCSPKQTPVLLVFEGEQRRPQIYVSPDTRVPNGGVPRSTSIVHFEGEPWMQFSYQFPWNEQDDSLEKFVITALSRFAKNE
jgi:hypothetical protein